MFNETTNSVSRNKILRSSFWIGKNNFFCVCSIKFDKIGSISSSIFGGKIWDSKFNFFFRFFDELLIEFWCFVFFEDEKDFFWFCFDEFLIFFMFDFEIFGLFFDVDVSLFEFDEFEDEIENEFEFEWWILFLLFFIFI